MDTNTSQSNWNEVKSKIKSKWSKFSDNEIDSLKGNLEALSDKIQKVYGYAKDRAEREYNEFKTSLKSSPPKVDDQTKPGGPLKQ